MALGFLSFDQIKEFIDLDNVKRQFVMLGLDENDQVDDDSAPEVAGKTVTEEDREHARHHGRAYVAVELSPPRWTPLDEFPAEKAKTDAFVAKLKEEKGWTFPPYRPGAPYGFDLSEREAGIVAVARSMLDWNLRNVFCAGCGRKTGASPSGMDGG